MASLACSTSLFCCPCYPACATALTAAEQPPPPSELMSLGQKFNPSMAIVMIAIVSAFFFMGFFSVYLRQCIERRVRGRFNAEIVGIGGHRSWSEQLGYWEVSHFRILGGKGAQDRERGAGMRGVPKRVRRRRNAAFAPQVQSRVSLRLYRSLVGLSRHLSGLSGQPYSQTRWKILRSSTHFWAGNWIRWIGHQSRDRWGAKPSSDCRGRAVPRCNESLECSRVRTPRVIRWFNRVRIARGRVFNILLLEQGEPWKRQQISFDRRP